jgi:Tfp pilus assembly protein PilF
MGKYGKAATAYSNALKIDAHNVMARLAYGEDLLKLHHPTWARAQFVQVIKQDPASTTAYADLALADEQLGHTSRAIAELRHQIAINRQNHALLAGNFRDLGLIYAAHKRWLDAAAALAQAVAFGARTAQDYYNLGYAQARAGERGDALRSLRKAQALAQTSGQEVLASAICKELTRLGAAC